MIGCVKLKISWTGPERRQTPSISHRVRRLSKSCPRHLNIGGGHSTLFYNKFILAPVCPAGSAGDTIKAWTATCLIHTADGQRCNKSLTCATLSPAVARRRIIKWCIGGGSIPNIIGGKAKHMEDDPRKYLMGLGAHLVLMLAHL